MKINKEKYSYLYRHYIKLLIKLFNDEYKVVRVYRGKYNSTIFHIELDSRDIEYFKNIDVFEVSLKDLYLFFFIEEYPRSNSDYLIYFANKDLKKYKNEDIMALLGVTAAQLKRFEDGIHDFTGPFSYDKLAHNLGFDREEFNIKYKNIFTNKVE